MAISGARKLAAGGSGLRISGVRLVIGYAVMVAALAMALVVRRLVGRVTLAFDQAGHVPASWVAAILVGVPCEATSAGYALARPGVVIVSKAPAPSDGMSQLPL
jgi:uncharacterized membrane protein